MPSTRSPLTTWLLALAMLAIGTTIAAGLAIFAALSLLDSNRFKPALEALVADHSNVVLDIAGDLDLQLLPAIALSSGAMSLHVEDSNNKDAPLARISSLSFRIALAPLLRGHVQIESLLVDGLAVHLQSGLDGRGNWQDLVFGNDKEGATETSMQTDADEQGSPATAVHFDIRRIQFENANILYRDARSDDQHQLSIKQLLATDINTVGEIIALRARSQYVSAAVGELASSWQAQLRLDNAADNLEFLAIDNQSQWRRQAGVEPLPIKAQASLSYSLRSSTLRAFEVNATLDDVSLVFRQHDRSDTLAGELALTTSNLTRQLNRLGIALPASRDSDALQNINLTADLGVSESSLSLSNLIATLDQTQLGGQFKSNWAGDTPRIDAELAVDALDLSKYLPADDGSAESANATTHSNQKHPADSADNTPAPLEVLNQLNGSLSLKVEQLLYDNLALQQMELDTNLERGVLTLETLSAALYGGTLQTKGQLSTQTTPAKLHIQQSLAHVQLAPLLAALDIEHNFSGAISGNAQLTMLGDSLPTWRRSLTGQTRFSIDQGVYGESNIEHLVCQAVAKVRNEKLTAQWPSVTAFETLTGSVDWQQGVGTINDLNASLATASVSGRGHVWLADARYSIDLDAILSGDTAGYDAGCAINEKYRAIAWPLECNSDDTPRRCGIDNSRLDKLLVKAAKHDLRRKAEKKVEKKLEEKLKDELGEKLGEDVKGLLEQLLK